MAKVFNITNHQRMQIKTTMRYHSTPGSMAIMKNKMDEPQILKNRTTVSSSNPTSGYIPKEMKLLSQRDICTPMFSTALFTIAKIWK